MVRKTLLIVFAILPVAMGRAAASDSLVTKDRVSPKELVFNQPGQGSIVGTVIDAELKYPIAGAEVKVLGSDKSTTTGKDGQFRIGPLPDGYYQIEATAASGYDPAIRNNVHVEGGRDEPLFFELRSAAGSSIPPDFVPVDKQPIPTSTPAPKYPETARRDSIEGVIWVKLVVDQRGNVDTVSLINVRCTKRGVDLEAPDLSLARSGKTLSSDERSMQDLAQVTLATAKEWKFTPASLGGKPVTVWVTIPFKYKLNPGGESHPSGERKSQKPKK